MIGNIQGFFASWLTAKSETSELIMLGPRGIISIKVVSSQGGRKTQVFSGFDPATWDWNEGSQLPTTSSSAWEHKYIESQEATAKKYGATVKGLEPGRESELIDQLPHDVASAIREHAARDEKARDHLLMFGGLPAGVSSMRGSDKTPIIPPHVIEAEERAKQRRLEDSEWGRF